MHLIELIKRFRKGIIIAFLLVIVEDVAWIVEPYVFGRVIDAVIDVQVQSSETDSLKSAIDTINLNTKEAEQGKQHSFQTIKDSVISFFANQKYESSYTVPLLIWILFFAINSGMGTLRRSVDPRIFLNIYTKIATEVSEISIKFNLSPSKTAARAELSHQYIGFLQYRAPEITENIIAIGGAVFALYFFDSLISLACLLIVIPLYFANRLYNSRVLKLQKEYHDKYEDIFDVFAKKDPVYVKEYFTMLAKPQKKIADWGAFNFGIMRVTLLGIFLTVLYIAIDLDDFSAGEIYSIVAYLWTFVTATEYLPELLESWTSLKDISKRMKFE